MATMRDLFDRKILNDESARIYADDELLKYANLWLAQMRRDHADLFIGSLAVPQTTLSLGEEFPLPPEYEDLCANYVIARASSRDDEHMNSNRAAGFLNISRRPTNTGGR